MGSLPGLVAHGGLWGAIVEGVVALGVAAVLVAVWLRERRGGADEEDAGAPALSEAGEERETPRT